MVAGHRGRPRHDLRVDEWGNDDLQRRLADQGLGPSRVTSATADTHAPCI